MDCIVINEESKLVVLHEWPCTSQINKSDGIDDDDDDDDDDDGGGGISYEVFRRS